MRINILGKQTFASAILVSVVNGITFWLRKYDVNVSENELYQLYYEIGRFLERSKIGKFLQKVDEQQFYNFLDEFIKVVDSEVTKNPRFFDNKVILWKIFSFFQNLLNKKWIRNNPVTREMQYQINKKIIETPELLGYKVKRDVDMAIMDYNDEVKKMNLDPEIKPIYSEKPSDGSNAQNLLGGEMRLRSPWMDQDP
jgi:hypothetical protein